MKKYILNLLSSNTINGNLLFCVYDMAYNNIQLGNKIVSLDIYDICKHYKNMFGNNIGVFPYNVKKVIYIFDRVNFINMHSNSCFDDIFYSVNDEYFDVFKSYIQLSIVL